MRYRDSPPWDEPARAERFLARFRTMADDGTGVRVASARVLEKNGFVREGTLREQCVVNGDVSDTWVYGLIRREWEPSVAPVPAR